MKKRTIMAVPEICFWAVIIVCLTGIVIGSFWDYPINEAQWRQPKEVDAIYLPESKT